MATKLKRKLGTYWSWGGGIYTGIPKEVTPSSITGDCKEVISGFSLEPAGRKLMPRIQFLLNLTHGYSMPQIRKIFEAGRKALEE